jgi:hypothetical protein
MKKWIGYDCEFELLYRGTENGKSAKNFHEKCDNKGPTISLIRTLDGSKFGGFTDLCWESINSYKTGKRQHNTFLFSLNFVKNR